MRTILFESKIKEISRKELTIVLFTIVIPMIVCGKAIAVVFSINAALFLFLSLGLFIVFAINYWWGSWSDSSIQFFAEGQYFGLDEVENKKILQSFKGLKLTGYGWIYEDFSSIITKEEEEVEIPTDEPRRRQETSNLMIVMQLKSEKSTLYLLESLSPWRSTPSQLPYFHLRQLDKKNIYFHVKGLEKLIDILNPATR